MVSIRQRIWFVAWPIIILLLGSGAAGTVAIIFGSSGAVHSILGVSILTTCMYRYIYIPLGGTKNVVISTVLIFTFVALWHDLWFRLLAWGWLVCLFIAPELTAKYFLPASKVRTPTNDYLSERTLTRTCGSMEAKRGIDMSALVVGCSTF